MLDVALGYPGAGADLRNALAGAASRAQGIAMICAGFAYVTRSGLSHIVPSILSSDQLARASKQWLIGIHHAISEPAAIEQLAKLDRSEVRLAVCGTSIDQAIRGHRVFHAKVIVLQPSRPQDGIIVISGSANLTGGALGARARNYEFCNIFSGLDEKVVDGITSWWTSAWTEGVPATRENLDRYARVRERFIRDNPDVVESDSQTTAAELPKASMLWIEAGSMSGGARNQVEFNEELAGFFGPVQNRKRIVEIEYGNRRWADRPLTPKRTTFGVKIWRLSLPTATTGGPEYAGKTVMFQRCEGNDGRPVYRLSVAESSSAEAISWREQTHRYGVVGRTGGARSYGYV